MPTVQSSIKYQTESFVESLIKEVADETELDVVVATLPAYHHLKKAIFELRKNQQFTSRFDIKFVLTKVSANNFFLNENRNIFQFLIENCMKGVS